MKTIFKTFGLIVFGAVTALLIASGIAGAATLTVNASGGADHTRIQDAIDSASTGDAILVMGGATTTLTYHENVNVNKQLILRGIDIGGGNPVVDAQRSGSAFTLSANGITLDGFTAMGAGSYPEAGIKVTSNSNMLISNNAANNDDGIYLGSSSNNTLSGNTISNNRYGIYLVSSSNNNTLIGNNASNNLYGIYLVSSGNNNTLIANKASSNNASGIYLDFSSNNTLSGNDASNNFYGIYLVSSSNNTLIGNNAANNDNGINLVSSNSNMLIDNKASSNKASGINLFSSSNNNMLIGNKASSNSGYGVYLVSSSNNTLIGNNAANNFYGIYLYTNPFLSSSSNSNMLIGNNATNSSFGIYLYSSNNNTLSDNNASSNNFYGISLESSSNNTLIGNKASSNTNYGISLESSSNNTLSGNKITENTYNFNLGGTSDSDFNNHIDTSNLVDGRPIYYIIKASDMIYDSSKNVGTLYCIGCVNVTIKSMNLNENSKGIFFWNTTGSRIQSVNVSNNGYGIYLVSSSNNTLSDNNASNNSDGIYLVSSSNDTVNGNTVSNNGYGIYLVSSSNNTIYNNYFSNTNNAYDNGNNIWNIPKTSGTNIITGAFLGGNFWSDYSGNDIDGDGLGDTMLPYNSLGRIANSGDYLPLIHVTSPGLETPNITSFSPTTSTVSNNVGDSKTFSITTNQTVNVSWLINETEVFNETGAIKSDYINSSAALGTWNVTAVASNNNGTVRQTWVWTVTPVPTAGGSISGYKINDTNGNGKWDAGEKGISNWTIRLIGIMGQGKNAKVIRNETLTDATGFYKFDNLPAGRYFVIEKFKKGFVPTSSPVKRIKLAQGKNSMNNNFTNRPVHSRDVKYDNRDIDDYEAINRDIDKYKEDMNWE